MFDSSEIVKLQKLKDSYRNLQEITNTIQNHVQEMKQCIKKKESRTLDKFYTNEDIVQDIIKKIPNIQQYTLFVDPAAGNCIFEKNLPKNIPTISIDISPASTAPKTIFHKDFLSIPTSEFTKNSPVGSKPNAKILTITNPPFGRNSSLLLKFFRHAATFSTAIGFIMPNSFKKASMINKIPTNFHSVLKINLPKNSFNIDGKKYDVPCYFELWEKRRVPRPRLDTHLNVFSPNLYKFTTKESANASLTRVGIKAGTVQTSTDVASSSHYFLKIENKRQNNEESSKAVYLLMKS